MASLAFEMNVRRRWRIEVSFVRKFKGLQCREHLNLVIFEKEVRFKLKDSK